MSKKKGSEGTEGRYWGLGQYCRDSDEALKYPVQGTGGGSKALGEVSESTGGVIPEQDQARVEKPVQNWFEGSKTCCIISSVHSSIEIGRAHV